MLRWCGDSSSAPDLLCATSRPGLPNLPWSGLPMYWCLSISGLPAITRPFCRCSGVPDSICLGSWLPHRLLMLVLCFWKRSGLPGGWEDTGKCLENCSGLPLLPSFSGLSPRMLLWSGLEKEPQRGRHTWGKVWAAYSGLVLLLRLRCSGTSISSPTRGLWTCSRLPPAGPASSCCLCVRWSGLSVLPALEVLLPSPTSLSSPGPGALACDRLLWLSIEFLQPAGPPALSKPPVPPEPLSSSSIRHSSLSSRFSFSTSSCLCSSSFSFCRYMVTSLRIMPAL